MEWKDKPTESGWHWYWDCSGTPLGYERPTPIRIVEGLYTKGLFAQFPAQATEVKAHHNIYWAGPILPPPSED